MATDNWAREDSRRMLHPVFRVGDLQKTIDCYRDQFGMQLLRQIDVPDKEFSVAFMGYGPETENFALELTYNYGVDSYDLGEGFGHFAFYTPDAYKTCEDIKTAGGKVRHFKDCLSMKTLLACHVRSRERRVPSKEAPPSLLSPKIQQGLS